MCGICGFTGKLENREDVLKKMTAVITHRGPDSEGFYIDDSVNMGFRRLSIIDLDSGHQPIYNEDKTLVKLKLSIDTKYGSVMDYFEIFMQRMILCRKAAEKLGLQFKLIINEQQLI